MKHTLSLRKSVVLLLFFYISTVGNSLAFDFEYGDLQGSIHLYGENINYSMEPDSGYINGLLQLLFQTQEYKNFRGAVGFHGSLNIWELEDGDSSDAKGELLSELNLQFANDGAHVVFGRQEIETEWISDYHEAVTLLFTPNPAISIFGGYTIRIAEADENDITEFTDIGEDGAWFVESEYTLGKVPLSLMPYLIHINTIHTGYGIKAEIAEEEIYSLLFHYGVSNADSDNEEDGSVLNSEISLYLDELTIASGVIHTDSEGGAGFLDLLGDTMNHLEEGNLVFEPDANTIYLMAEYNFWSIGIELIVAKSKAEDLSEKEVNLILDYELPETLEGFSLEIIYAGINSENDEDDYDTLSFLLTYEF